MPRAKEAGARLSLSGSGVTAVWLHNDHGAQVNIMPAARIRAATWRFFDFQTNSIRNRIRTGNRSRAGRTRFAMPNSTEEINTRDIFECFNERNSTVSPVASRKVKRVSVSRYEPAATR